MSLRTLVLAIALLAPVPALAQGVLVAPTAVFIDSRSRAGSLLLVNPNDDPAEVDMSALFGYPVTDSLGQTQLFTAEQPDSAEPSAAGWIKIFPRRMTLAPKGQQTVRVLVSPPPTAADGEYWTRLVIVARGGKLPVTVVDSANTAGLSVGLTMEVRTIIPLFFRKGKAEAGLAVSALRANRAADSLLVRARLERTGNAAALGTARGEMVDSTGKVRATFNMPVAVYHAIEPRFSIAAANLPPGRYRLRFEVAAARQDLPAESVLPFRAVRDSVSLTLP